MTHLDTELQLLKNTTLDMWGLVISQLDKGKKALMQFDSDLAREVGVNEKRVNALELKIDSDCENIFALFNPVAIDLRFVLAVLKINNNLERTGDIAESISRFVVDTEKEFDPELMNTTRITELFNTAIEMLKIVEDAFTKEDTTLARTVFKMDEFLDKINGNASHIITDYIKKHPDNTRQALHVLSMIRKLERVGDQSKNIAEEIIFYVEAKVLKHMKKK